MKSKKAYERYKLQWMADHEVTIEDIGNLANDWKNEGGEESFSDYIEEYGFAGSIWVCYEEFLDCEYKEIIENENYQKRN
ncbi:MAG TPA: hypothetical protein DCW90_09390 [Lachnospiraceae bacterium]|nr:hypothetical protein [Lachnospiraceae bacterium]